MRDVLRNYLRSGNLHFRNRLGTPEQIRQEVCRRAEMLGSNGGYIIAPAHNVQDDTPEENILAFFEAVSALSI